VPPLHPDVAPLAFLLGTWRGEGTGSYPTIEPFSYTEELVFEHAGDAFLLYRGTSWSPEGEPLHFERGFLRPGAGPRELELCLAHPLGLTEIAHGTIEGHTIMLRTEDGGGIGRTRTGSAVTGLERHYAADGDALRADVDMEMSGTPMVLHTSSQLRRDQPP
jgi:hypothetical protein